MAGVFTRIPANTFREIGANGGMLLTDWNPNNPYEISEAAIVGATTGGINFQAQYDYTDYGEDIDNCPKNTKELKRVNDVTVTVSGTLVTMKPETAKLLSAHADISGNKITPRALIDIDDDFNDLWLLLDYSEVNTGSGAGFIAVHIMSALSTGGFQLQSTDKEKAQFSFEFTGHFSIDAQDTVPFEVYVQAGSSGGDTPEIMLDKHTATVSAGSTVTLVPIRLVPAGSTITWTSSSTTYAEVSGGVVTGKAEGSAIITASITDSGVTYSDTCTIIVEAASA